VKTWFSFCTSTRLHNAVNRSIFLLYQINLHALQSHTLQRHDIVFAHIHRKTATSLHTRCNSYISHTHTLQRHDSAFTHLQTCVMQQINWFFPFSDRFTHIAITHRAVTTLDSALNLYMTFTHTLRRHDSAFAHLHVWVNRSIFCFIRSIYMHRNHIHCKNTTQSLLIYTKRQQRLCACVATNIQHLHSHYEDTTQLLHTYTFVQRSKSIDFLLYQIDLHASQSYTLQRHDTVFAHIHRTTATFLHTRCNLYTSHTYTLRRHDSAFAHLHAHVMQ